MAGPPSRPRTPLTQRRQTFLLGILAAVLTRPAYAFFGRDTVTSLLPAGAVQIDGRATEWSDMPVLEQAGMSFRAMNDDSNLYLLIRGTTADGRVLLSGKYRQNVALWFLKPDHKTRDWGLNLDFDRAQPPAPDAPPTLASWGIVPERIIPQGLEVSTSTFPSDFEFQADLSSQRGRQPIYEMRIPLNMIEQQGKSVYLDFVTSEVSPEVKAELANIKAEPQTEPAKANGGGNGAPGGGRHHRGMGGTSGGASASRNVDVPKPLQLHLTVVLAKKS